MGEANGMEAEMCRAGLEWVRALPRVDGPVVAERVDREGRNGALEPTSARGPESGMGMGPGLLCKTRGSSTAGAVLADKQGLGPKRADSPEGWDGSKTDSEGETAAMIKAIDRSVALFLSIHKKRAERVDARAGGRAGTPEIEAELAMIKAIEKAVQEEVLLAKSRKRVESADEEAGGARLAGKAGRFKIDEIERGVGVLAALHRSRAERVENGGMKGRDKLESEADLFMISEIERAVGLLVASQGQTGGHSRMGSGRRRKSRLATRRPPIRWTGVE